MTPTARTMERLRSEGWTTDMGCFAEVASKGRR